MKKFIAVAGNIGVGKSTLVSLLSERLGWKPFLSRWRKIRTWLIFIRT